MHQNRGRLLYIGLMGVEEDTIEGQKKYLIQTIIMVITAVVFLAALLTVGDTSSGYLPFSILLFFFILLILIYALNRILGKEIDGIYENGLTHRYMTFIDRLKDENFIYYGNISKIRYGIMKTGRGISPYLRIFIAGKKKPLHAIAEIFYKNDYFEQLFEILKVKCPNAVWEEIDKT